MLRMIPVFTVFTHRSPIWWAALFSFLLGLFVILILLLSLSSAKTINHILTFFSTELSTSTAMIVCNPVQLVFVVQVWSVVDRLNLLKSALLESLSVLVFAFIGVWSSLAYHIAIWNNRFKLQLKSALLTLKMSSNSLDLKVFGCNILNSIVRR